jgi:hypothetical protein
MKNLPKIFLVSSAIAFAIGLSDLAENRFFYMGRPVGAILFVLFMIFQFLQKETALYDAEEQKKLAGLKVETKAPMPERKASDYRHREISAHSPA